jgi:two-component system chemotaxis response regulator CheB
VDAILCCEELATAISEAAWGGHPPTAPAALPDSVPGKELTIVCPECGGVLTETVEAGVPRWECHVGHLYSPSSLNTAQGTEVERALWAAMRMLRDRAALLRRLADQASRRGHGQSEEKFRAKAREADDQADDVLGVLSVSTASALSAAETGGGDEEVA